MAMYEHKVATWQLGPAEQAIKLTGYIIRTQPSLTINGLCYVSQQCLLMSVLSYHILLFLVYSLSTVSVAIASLRGEIEIDGV